MYWRNNSLSLEWEWQILEKIRAQANLSLWTGLLTARRKRQWSAQRRKSESWHQLVSRMYKIQTGLLGLFVSSDFLVEANILTQQQHCRRKCKSVWQRWITVSLGLSVMLLLDKEAAATSAPDESMTLNPKPTVWLMWNDLQCRQQQQLLLNLDLNVS